MIVPAVLLTILSECYCQLQVANEPAIIDKRVLQNQMLRLLLNAQEAKIQYRSLLASVNSTLERINEKMTKEQLKPSFGSRVSQTFQGCDEIYEAGFHTTGVYDIWIVKGYRFVPVYCDMETVGKISKRKGWLTIQRRINGEVNFDRGWADYVSGFGYPHREHWIGLQNIYLLTNERRIGEEYYLRIDIEDWNGAKGFMEYSAFEIMKGEKDYNLKSIGKYTGSEGLKNPLRFGVLRPFSTSDHNNDNWRSDDCVRRQRGGWWFGPCLEINLNGRYPINHGYSNEAMFLANWERNESENSGLRFVSMKLQ